jgi:hypothetical protein
MPRKRLDGAGSMQIVTHVDTISWLAQPAFFMSLIAYLLDAAVLMTVVGLVHALLFGRLSIPHASQHRQRPDRACSAIGIPFGHGRIFGKPGKARQGACHEA